MGVGVQREPCGVMPQHAGQSLSVHPALHGESGEGVPEVVEPHAGVKPRRIQQPFVDAPDGLRTPVGAGLGGHEHQWAVGVTLMLGDEQLHCLLRHGYLADGVLRLWLGHHQLAVLPGHLLVYREDAALHVQVLPQQGEQLAPAQAAGQRQIEDGQYAVLLGFLQVSPYLLGRDDFHLRLFLFGDTAVIAGVIRYQPLLHRLL